MVYKSIEGDLVLNDEKICIIQSRFNSFITEKLVEGAIDVLRRHKLKFENFTIIKVPGAFEIPSVLNRVLKSANNFNGIITLGAVIRGETPHFDYVAAEVSKGIANISINSSIPITFGILTTDNIEQAIERAGTKAGNKGADAAISLIEMISLYNKIENNL